MLRSKLMAGSWFLAFALAGCSDGEIGALGGSSAGGHAGTASAGLGGAGGQLDGGASGGGALECESPKPSALEEQASPSAPFVFHVVGDVHAHPSDPRSYDNIVLAMNDLNAIDPNPSALVINGDLTEHGYLNEWDYLKSALAGRTPAETLYTIGNHEYHGTNSSAVELGRFLDFAGVSSVYYEKSIGDYAFLFLGGENGDADLPSLAWTAVLSDAQLAWLDEHLTALASERRPTFVFLHQPLWDSTQPELLKQTLGAHPNVVFVWSHYHRDLRNSAIEPSQYGYVDGFLSVHTGAVQYCWDSAKVMHYDCAQGLRVEVYPDYVMFHGRDFPSHAWIGGFRYEFAWRKPLLLGSSALAKDGRLWLFLADSEGSLASASQLEPGGAWSSFEPGDAIASAPTAALDAQGRVELFAKASDGSLRVRVQSTPSGTWSDWTSLGGALLSNVAVAENLDGRLELFARGTDYAVWHIWQQSDSTWSDWQSLGGFLTADPVVGRNSDGRLEVFARGTDGQAYHVWQQSPGGVWGEWSNMGGLLVGNLALGSASDGRLQLFSRGSNRALFRNRQLETDWSGWESIGGDFESDPVVVLDASGRLVLFARGADDALYTSSQAGDSWSDWTTLGGELASNPLLAKNAGGRLEVFALASDGTLRRIQQQQPGACWSTWSNLGGSFKAF